MPSDYNDWRLCQVEDEHSHQEQQDDAVLAVETELANLLESNGLGDLYYALTGTPAFENALKAEAKARNPELFH